MFTLQNLDITRILPRRDGIFVFAKYPQWHYEYNFLILSDGKVKGKTSGSNWLELDREDSAIIRAKVKTTLIENNNLIFA